MHRRRGLLVGALRWPASSSARRRPPTISPRTAAGSRKRTSVLAGWTLTSTSSSGTSRNNASDRVAVAGEQVAIGGAHRADQQPVLHRPAVDEQILLVGHAAVEGRQADRRRSSRSPSRAQSMPTPLAVELAVEQLGDPRRRPRRAGACRMRRPSCSSVKPMSRPRHRQPLHDVEAGGIFGARASAGTCAAPAPCRTDPRPDPRAGRQRRRPLARQPRHDRSRSRQPSAPRTRLSSVSRATLAIDGSASPRKPKLVDPVDRIVGQLRGGVALQRQRASRRAPCRSRRR